MPHETQYRVYYEDTDAGGIMYYANFLKFAERGRTELLRTLGFENRSLRDEQKIGFVVRRVEIDYFKSALLDDLLSVKTDVKAVKNSSLVMAQSIFCRNDLLCSMDVVLVCVGEDFKACRMPDELKKAFANLEAQTHVS